MSHRFAEIAFTGSVKAAQEHYGARAQNARLEASGPANDALGPAETAFIEQRDTFFMASVSETGWPYVQHRGGPRGFLRVVGARRLAFADFRGNRQYVSTGNLARDDRVALILVDFAQPRRLKILGHARIVDAEQADPEIRLAVALPDYRAVVERVAVIDVEAFAWNCPRHIAPRYTREELEAILPER